MPNQNLDKLLNSNTSTNESPFLTKVKVGISACLVGENVRYNAGHSQSKLCLNDLSPYFQWQAFCPEVAAGFSTPRPTMRLVGKPESPTLISPKQPDIDLNHQLEMGYTPHLNWMKDLHGYVLMKNSPSCGLERVKVYQPNGHPHQVRTRGLFTQALQARFPLLPIEEEGRLHDPHLLENFVMRVYVHYRFYSEVFNQLTLNALQTFHWQHKYLLMAHAPKSLKLLGNLLAKQKDYQLEHLAKRYFSILMHGLKTPASKGQHSNTLQHLLGYLRPLLNNKTRKHLHKVILRYRIGELPLATPITLIQHYLDQSNNHYLKRQRYFDPYPQELGLANYI